MQRAVLEGGGDYPAMIYYRLWTQCSSLSISMLRKEILSNQDQLSIEWAGTYKHYHSAMVRTIPIGKVNPKHIKCTKPV